MKKFFLLVLTVLAANTDQLRCTKPDNESGRHLFKRYLKYRIRVESVLNYLPNTAQNKTLLNKIVDEVLSCELDSCRAIKSFITKWNMIDDHSAEFKDATEIECKLIDTLQITISEFDNKALFFQKLTIAQNLTTLIVNDAHLFSSDDWKRLVSILSRLPRFVELVLIADQASVNPNTNVIPLINSLSQIKNLERFATLNLFSTVQDSSAFMAAISRLTKLKALELEGFYSFADIDNTTDVGREIALQRLAVSWTNCLRRMPHLNTVYLPELEKNTAAIMSWCCKNIERSSLCSNTKIPR